MTGRAVHHRVKFLLVLLRFKHQGDTDGKMKIRWQCMDLFPVFEESYIVKLQNVDLTYLVL